MKALRERVLLEVVLSFSKIRGMWIVYALLAALTAGISVTLTKSGLKKVDPVIAFAIQSILILLICWGMVWFQKKGDTLKEIDRTSWIFLILAGVSTCLSSLFQFHALQSGKASTVSPLVQLSLFFSIFFAVIFLKETLNWKIIAGEALMIGGAVLISVSTRP